MASLDLDFVRSQFPAFGEPSLAGFAHFENAGGSFASRQTIEALHRYYRQTKVQPYYPFEPSATAGALMDSAKERLAAWLNVQTDELHIGPSTSQNTYALAQAFRKHLGKGDEVIVTNQDHEANIGAWSRLQDDGIVVRTWSVDATGALRVADLEALLGPRTRLVAFTHCSNVVGSINPAGEIIDLVHRAGAWAAVDGVGFCPHGLPDVTALGADIYLFSLYKVYGPHQGAMVVRANLAAELPSQAHFFKADAIAGRFTPAGPDHAQVAAVNGVIDYMEAVARHHGLGGAPVQAQAAAVRELFRNAESERLQPLLEFLAHHPKVRLIGSPRTELRAPTVAFTAQGHSSDAIARRLAERRIGVGSGNFYAYRLIEALGIDTTDGVVRTSFVHYTTAGEIERLIGELQALLQ
jgi:cysteine desulfurase family protein (TIGR01976 family)